MGISKEGKIHERLFFHFLDLKVQSLKKNLDVLFQNYPNKEIERCLNLVSVNIRIWIFLDFMSSGVCL